MAAKTLNKKHQCAAADLALVMDFGEKKIGNSLRGPA